MSKQVSCIDYVRGGAHACVHTQRMNTCTQLREINKHSYLSQMKSDLHKTFSICQDWSTVLINNVHGGAHACVHAQRVNTCTQLREVNKPSYLSQIKSDLHKTFSVCRDWSPVSGAIGHPPPLRFSTRHLWVHYLITK